MMRIHAIGILCVALFWFACEPEGTIEPFDLEGPQGQVSAPGPWTFAVLTDGRRPRVYYARENDAFTSLSLLDLGGGQYVGLLPAPSNGAYFRYYAAVDDLTLPIGGRERARVVSVTTDELPTPVSGGPCRLDFLTPPEAADVLYPSDDSAPQAGLQQNYILSTNLNDAHPVRMRIGDVSHSSQTQSGFVAFIGVTVPLGASDVRVDATRGEFTCGASIRVVNTDTPLETAGSRSGGGRAP